MHDTATPQSGAAAPAPVRALVERALRSAGVPGCSVAVVTRDGIRWADGFGLADLRAGRAARADTVYRLFSGTKLYTATAVLFGFLRSGSIAMEISAQVPAAVVLICQGLIVIAVAGSAILLERKTR